MKLIDLLEVVSEDTYIGIWNIDKKGYNCPTRQHYQKAKNLPWEKIGNIVYLEVMYVNVVDNGLLIRIYDKESLENKTLSTDIAIAIKRSLVK